MPAPSGIVWGSIVGDYGRIGIYSEITANTGTIASWKTEVWFWSKYSVSDTSNTLYYNDLSNAGEATTSKGSQSISTTVATGEGWSTANQQKLASYTNSVVLGENSEIRYLRARLINVDRVGGEMKVYATLTLPAANTYSVTYNANGGTGAPTSQTKKHDVALTLSTTKPTRAGYGFRGWTTTASSNTVTYAPGASYTENANLTLYAVWGPNSYTIKYNANGGANTPANQTKQHGTDLTLTTSTPTKAYHTFKGWGTSASSTTVAYAAGATYKANASITLYAIWERTYYKPAVYNLSATRCDSEGTETEEGTYALVKFDWIMSVSSGSCDITCLSGDTQAAQLTGISLETSGSASQIIGSGLLAVDITYTVEVTVTDANSGQTTVTTTLAGMKFPIDFLSGGGGVAFGKNAELEDTAEFEFDAQFNGNVSGNVFGLSRLPHLPFIAIQGGNDFNDFLETGCYAIYHNANMEYYDNWPGSSVCGRLEVSSANGYGYRDNEYTYLRQKWIPYRTDYPTYERDITRDASNIWTYGEWVPVTLSKAASKKVYHEQKTLWSGAYYMTAAHTVTLSKKISEQANGIVLVFSAYSGGAAQDYYFQSFFVPKKLVSLKPGGGHSFTMFSNGFSGAATKYLYINDATISGHDDNNATGTTNGITYNNASYVLRYVIGV